MVAMKHELISGVTILCDAMFGNNANISVNRLCRRGSVTLVSAVCRRRFGGLSSALQSVVTVRQVAMRQTDNGWAGKYMSNIADGRWTGGIEGGRGVC